MDITIFILGLIGFLLSIYTFYIERKKEKNVNYKAKCDISDRVSCTKAFESKWGKTFGVSNSIYGIIFYTLVFILAFFNLDKLVFYLSLISFLISIYLIYILYLKVKSFCIVCNLIYVVNILLLIFSYI